MYEHFNGFHFAHLFETTRQANENFNSHFIFDKVLFFMYMNNSTLENKIRVDIRFFFDCTAQLYLRYKGASFEPKIFVKLFFIQFLINFFK